MATRNENEEIFVAEFAANAAFIRTVPPADAMHFLEQKATEFQPYVFSIREVRNSAVPIHALPHELVAEIFSLLLYDDEHSWTVFTRISRYLRAVALTSPQLWCRVNLANPRLARMFMDNCPAGSLHIAYCPSYPQMTAQGEPMDISISSNIFKQIVFGSLDRVKSLSILGTYEEISALDLALNPIGPQLRTLAVVSTSKGRVASWNPTYSSTYSVETLQLNRVSISSSSTIYQNVRHLTLKNLQTALEMGQLLHILSGCHALWTLELTSVSPEYMSQYANPATLNTLQLPHLRRIAIENSPQNISYLLSQISLPTTADLLLKSDIRDLEAFMTTIFPQNRNVFRYLTGIRSITHKAGVYLVFYVGNLHITFNWDVNSPGTQILLDRIALPLIQLLDELVEPRLLEHLSIQVDPEFHFDEDDWRDILLRVPNLRFLEFYQKDPEYGRFLRVGLFRAWLLRHQAGLAPYCPLLESLTFGEFNFANGSIFGQLEQFLTILVEQGLKLKVLRLPDALGLSQEEVDNFRLLVDNFEYTVWEEPVREPLGDLVMHMELDYTHSGESDSDDSS